MPTMRVRLSEESRTYQDDESAKAGIYDVRCGHVELCRGWGETVGLGEVKVADEPGGSGTWLCRERERSRERRKHETGTISPRREGGGGRLSG